AAASATSRSAECSAAHKRCRSCSGVPRSAIVAVIGSATSSSKRPIIAAVKRDLANYKVPKRVFFTGELPRNSMGKVQKNVLRESFAKTFSTPPEIQ
ncbi:MAG: hypothetical protein QF830_02180, partial [Rhodospirillales bacterium]|nr:hypothetical protein [Rhodospirillales bacterium]